MKTAILLLAFSLAVLSSCTTSYKTGQTPDDVYYSPARPQEEYVRSEKEEDRPTRYSDDFYEDRYLQMKVRNRTRWSDLDDWYNYDYRYRSNVYLGCCFCNNAWTPFSHWNNYYNPYYQNYVIIKNVSPVYNKPRNFNLNAYNNPTNTRDYSNTKTSGSTTNRNNTYTAPRNSTSDKRNDSGRRLRDIFDNSSSSSSGSNSSSSSSSNTKPSSSTSSGSSPSSSSSSTPAPVRRF